MTPSNTSFFSDRDNGPKPRIIAEIALPAWGGITALISSRAADGSLGVGFPESCPDSGSDVIGTNTELLGLSLNAEIPDISWPLTPKDAPPTLAILDLVEFIFRSIGKPIAQRYHGFFRHSHLSFDVELGQAEFCEGINRIFARNGLAYELESNGQIRRLPSPILGESLTSAVFSTGDAELDLMLEAARTKFLDPNPVIRRDALEKLWDAWERLKTLIPGNNKKESATALLSLASSEQNFLNSLSSEAKELTAIGNTFQIRHSETSQVKITDDAHVDYLFHRMFSLIWLLLKKCGRA